MPDAPEPHTPFERSFALPEFYGETTISGSVLATGVSARSAGPHSIPEAESKAVPASLLAALNGA